MVAAWGASRDGAADVYAAVSRDGGRSFGAPVRVNATPGEAALGGERAPRVAIAPRQGGPAIAVLWTAKAPPARAGAPAAPAAGTGHPPRRVDRSSAARSRRRSISRDANAPGIRGWAALAAGADGAWYAAWLDGRAEAAKKAAAGPAASPAAGAAAGGHHHHGGSTGSGPLQEVFYRVVGRDPQAKRGARRHRRLLLLQDGDPRARRVGHRPARRARHGPRLAPHLPELGARHRDERARCGRPGARA